MLVFYFALAAVVLARLLFDSGLVYFGARWLDPEFRGPTMVRSGIASLALFLAVLVVTTADVTLPATVGLALLAWAGLGLANSLVLNVGLGRGLALAVLVAIGDVLASLTAGLALEHPAVTVVVLAIVGGAWAAQRSSRRRLQRRFDRA